MPDAMGRLLDQLGQAPERRGFTALGTALAPGTPLPTPRGVLPRYVEAAADAP